MKKISAGILFALLLFITQVFAAVTLPANLGASRTSGMSPLSVQFNLSGTTSSVATTPGEVFRDIIFECNFDDPTSGNWGDRSTGTAGAQASSRNYGFGPIQAHVFELAEGAAETEFTVTCTANDGTNTTELSQVITVTPFTAANTKCVNNTGDTDFSACPIVGSGKLYADSAACVTGSQCLTTNSKTTLFGYLGTNIRVLLKRGGAWSSAVNDDFVFTGPTLMGAYDTGVQPELYSTLDVAGTRTIKIDGTVSDVRIADINFSGGTSNGNLRTAINHNSGTVTNFLLLRLYVHGLAAGVRSDQTTTEGFSIFDSSFTDFAGSGGGSGNGVYVAFSNSAIMGNEFARSSGDSEQLLRMATAINVVISNNHCEDQASTKECFALRSKDTPQTENVYLADNSFLQNGSGASDMITMSLSTGGDSNWTKILFEGNLVVFASTGGSQGFRTAGDFLTIRNNVFSNPSGGRTESVTGAFVTDANSGATYPAPSNVSIYNNTFFNASSTALTGISVETTTAAQVKNNLVYDTASSGGAVISNPGGAAVMSNNTCNTSGCTSGRTTSPSFDNGTGLHSTLADFRIGSGSAAATGGVTEFPAENRDALNCSSVAGNSRIGALIPLADALCYPLATITYLPIRLSWLLGEAANDPLWLMTSNGGW